jgi:protein-L-isoaspartate(D-aspartate) O-methyltransferase
VSERWEDAAREMVRGLGRVPAPIAGAMRRVPRHGFVPPEYSPRAYRDEAVPLGTGFASVSAPHMVALQLEAAGLRPGQRLLEVGSGSGYLLAVAGQLVGPSGHLIGLEIDPELAERSRSALTQLGIDAEIRVRDGRASVPDGPVFDAVIVSFAAPELFSTWTSALVEHGRLVAPVGDTEEQVLTTYQRTGAGGTVTSGPACRFVPLRPHI